MSKSNSNSGIIYIVVSKDTGMHQLDGIGIANILYIGYVLENAMDWMPDIDKHGSHRRLIKYNLNTQTYNEVRI